MADISDEALALVENHPWEETAPKLAYYALQKIKSRYWLGIFGGSTPAATEAEDIVMKSIKKILDGQRRWEPKQHPDLFKFLLGVIDSEISHLVESWENRSFLREESLVGYCSDEETADFWQTVPDQHPTIEAKLINQEMEEKSEKFFLEFYESVQDSPKLQSILDSIFEGHIKRADIAKNIGITVREFDNLKKQLRRRLLSFQRGNSGDNK